jgi:hypothetical protein
VCRISKYRVVVATLTHFLMTITLQDVSKDIYRYGWLTNKVFDIKVGTRGLKR